MKRNKEFIRNIIILCGLAFAYFYFGNFYLSEEKCLEEIKKSMYIEDFDVLWSNRINGQIQYTMVNHEDKSLYILTIDNRGPLYRYHEVFGNEIIYMDNDHSIDIRGIQYNQGFIDESTYIIYRNDERVHSIEKKYPDETVEICQEWKGNFCIFHEVKNVDVAIPHYVYDENHELIEIIEY